MAQVEPMDRQQQQGRRGGHRRGQSVMANQFSAHLDDLFSIDKGLDTTLRQVENKRQSVYVQQRELEELQERIREAEARLGQNSSDSSSDDDPDETPVSKRRGTNAAQLPSVFAIAETTEDIPIPKPVPVQARNADNQTPVSTNSAEYVVVRRPRPNPRKHPRVDSHIEVSSKETTEEEDSEVDSSEADSSEEEEEEEEE
ncbi:hypothetical protein EG327_008307 [Venturia inaequalis]|uniref:Uncharacterized protein n=1 Tax=Venturia inaequalis TaxID=5025 RepID=A0A8H3UUT4_VENIN|nr:hypothetical protein EG327_008307 [Venturia inaequalis]